MPPIINKWNVSRLFALYHDLKFQINTFECNNFRKRSWSVYVNSSPVFAHASDWIVRIFKNEKSIEQHSSRVTLKSSPNFLASSISSKLTVPFVHSPAPSTKSRRVLDSCAAPRSCCDTVPRWIRTLVSETRRERGTWERGRESSPDWDFSWLRRNYADKFCAEPIGKSRGRFVARRYTYAHWKRLPRDRLVEIARSASFRAASATAAAAAAVAFEWINRRKISKGFPHPSRPTAANTDPPHREN